MRRGSMHSADRRCCKPIVADIAVAVGSGTAVFGAADAIEGTQDIYYGSTGDIDSTAVNGIKDDLFQGNEDAYYLTENAFAFAASAMIQSGMHLQREI